jgi:RNA polymerase sigma factor (sigma-70 family)
MPLPPLDTQRLQDCVGRWQAGDRNAADELLAAAAARLQHLAHRMLRGFPTVRPYAETGDVLQGALLRLLNSLRELRPQSTRDFFNLASVQIRRELLDLARQFGARGGGRLVPLEDGNQGASDPPTSPADLELWCRFHEAVEGLPVDEREVVELIFYHGHTRAQVAELVGVAERTIYRRWESACANLNERLGGELPPV